MKLRIQTPKKHSFFTPFLLISFLIVQTSFIPTSFSFSGYVPANESGTSEVQFNVLQDEFLFIDYATNSYAVFPRGRAFDVPSQIGRLKWHEGQSYLVPTRFIRSEYGFYVSTDPKDSDFLMVTEKLPEGGFGRLLRYRGQIGGGEWVDLEFVYEDRENTVTILDFREGRFFRTTFKDERPLSDFLFPLSEEPHLTAELVATSIGSHKFLAPRMGFLQAPYPGAGRPHLPLFSLSDHQIWMTRLLRGPPAGGLQP